MPPESTLTPKSEQGKTQVIPSRLKEAQQDHWLVKWGIILTAVGIVGLLVILPVVFVFARAFENGIAKYWSYLVDDEHTTHSIMLTLLVAAVSVSLNVVFGVIAAWALSRFKFPGRTVLTTLIDLPFSVSPVVAGLMYVLLFGQQGYWGPWLRDHGIEILFSPPALIIATTFVTLPFVVRELIPVMEATGSDEEVAALSLGASGWQMFWHVTLPNIKWGLLYGIILCNARAMGEFGAVSVVSGHQESSTETVPLRVEKLFQNSELPASFAVASLLTMLALVTLVIKVILEHKVAAKLAEAKRDIAETAS